MYRFVFLLFCIFVLLPNVYSLQVVDLTRHEMTNQYANVNGTVNPTWKCRIYNQILIEDPAGITNATIVEASYFRVLRKNATAILYTFTIDLLPSTTQYVIKIFVNGDPVFKTHTINYICDHPPTPLDITILDVKPIYTLSHLTLSMYFLFKMNNIDADKLNGPLFEILSYDRQYTTTSQYVDKGIYCAVLAPTINTTSTNPIEIGIRYDNYENQLYYFNYTLTSPFPDYNNQIVSSNPNFMTLPLDTSSNLRYPTFSSFFEVEFTENKPLLSLFSYEQKTNPAVLVQGNYTHGTYYSKFAYTPNNTQITFTALLDPMINQTKTFNYIASDKPTVSAVVASTALPDVVSQQFQTNVTFKADVIAWSSMVTILPYPFGYSSGNSISYLRKNDMPFNNENFISGAYGIKTGVDNDIVSYDFISGIPTIVPDNQPPVIESIESYVCPDGNHYVIKLRITDNLSGFSSIYYYGDYTDIVSGDLNDGYYEFLRPTNDLSFMLLGMGLIYDQLNNLDVFTYRYGDVLTIDLQEFPYKILNFSNVVNIEFEMNEIDVSHSDVYNRLFIYTSNIDKTIHPGMMVPKYGDEPINLDDQSLTYSGSWDDSMGCYVIPFMVRKNFSPGFFEYVLKFGAYSIHYGSFFGSWFGEKAMLNIISKTTDILGPIVINLSVENRAVTIPNSVFVTLVWNLTIHDMYNGFSNGQVSITSSLDLVKYNTSFTAADLIEGDIYDGVYQFKVRVNPKCKSQTFYISYLYLEDNGTYYSLYREGGEFPTNTLSQFINPFLFAPDVTTASSVVVDCQNALVDTTPPTLTAFSFSPNFVDVFDSGELYNNSREVIFQMTASDDNGILLGSPPTVYLQDKRTRVVSQVSELVSSTDTEAVFRCNFTVPFGFGFKSDIYVSVFGIVDNQSNFKGYSISQLAAASFPYKLQVQPLLTHNVSVFSTINLYESGHISIRGRNFDPTDQLLIRFNNGTFATLSNSIFNTNSIIVFNNPSFIPIQDLTITIQKSNGKFSNSVNVQVKKTPHYGPPASSTTSSSQESSSSDEPPVTNKPQTCISDCGGIDHGVCTPAGCVCKSPWVGASCTSQVIIIDPVINSTTPSTNIKVPTKDKTTAIYYAIISVVALNELDQNGQLVQKHEFPSWIVSNNTISKYSQYTNSSYLYTSSINNNNITTNVNVSIDYFNQDQPVNITFANQIITMNPYSLKYSVNISEYSFSSSLNTLQLIILSSLETENNDECASKQFGDTVESNSEYIKMQVNDHSLYGRFIKRGVVDGRVKSVSNTLLDNQYNSISTQSEQQTYIGINIPFYSKSVQLDPDFSVLIDTRPASDTQDAICGGKSKSKLTKPQLIGIIIGGVAFAAVLVVGLTYIVYKKRQKSKFEASLSSKLSQT